MAIRTNTTIASSVAWFQALFAMTTVSRLSAVVDQVPTSQCA
jgi:hypothetical protein